MTKVGILLGPPPEDLGGWLTDAAAFDAAGADALWLGAVDGELDPLAVTAALAALTFRSLLVTTLPPGAPPARTLTTISRLSRGRLAVCGDPGESAVEIFHPHDELSFEREVAGEQPERWERTEPPAGRAAWRAALAGAAERGVAGLLVPAQPQILDLLRNPDQRGDRRDLHIAQG